jgi:nucleotide-binding universal stress UspA family protein
MFNRILVPLDGSQLAEGALPYALSLAAALDASLTLLTVVQPMQLISDYYIPYDASLEAEQLAAAGAALDETADSLRHAGARVMTAVAVGYAASEILHYTEENGIDGIVMATHGRGGAFHWAFGSVARKVLTAATVPTLVVRAQEAPTHPETAATIGRILVPLDGSERAESVLPLVMDLARSSGASVTLARIVQFPGGIYFASPYAPMVAAETFDQSMAETREAAKAYLHAAADRFRAAGIGAETVMQDGDAAGRLLRLLDAQPFDLVVMATHGRTGIPRFVLGSVAERMIEASHTPVLLVRSLNASTVAVPEVVTVGQVRDATDATR